MPTFVCEKCGCVDNSACGGTYWTRNMPNLYPDTYKGELLCCVWAPQFYRSGERNRDAGVWHNRFPRKTQAEWDDENKSKKE